MHSIVGLFLLSLYLLVTDTVTLGPGLVIEQQQIGVAIISQGFEGVDGILGVGPVDLTQGTLQNDPNAFVPTVSDNLLSQGAISEEVLGIFFAPTTSVVAANGEGRKSAQTEMHLEPQR